jgi:hypothetical protein
VILASHFNKHFRELLEASYLKQKAVRGEGKRERLEQMLAVKC